MAGTPKDVRAGGAFYELWGKDGLSGVLDKAKKKALAFGSFMQQMGTRVGLAGAALGAPLVALFRGGMNRAADTARMAEQLNIPIDLMSKLQYAAEAAGVSVQEVMDDMSGRYRGLINRAPGLDPEAARKAAEAQLQLKDATLALQNALLPLMSIVTPYVKQFTEFVQKNAGAARLVAEIAVRLVVFAAVIKATAAAVAVLTTAFAVLKTVAIATWLAVSGPIGLGVLLGTLLGTGLFLLLANAADGCKALGKGFSDLFATATSAWGGITAALAKGDLQQAWDVLLAGLDLAWAELVHSLTHAWIKFKTDFVDGWKDLGAAIEMVWTRIMSRVVQLTARALANIFSGFADIAGRLGMDGLSDALRSASRNAALFGEGAGAWDRETQRRLEREAHERDMARAREHVAADAALAKKKEELAAAVEKAKNPDLLGFLGGAAGAIGGGFGSAALKGVQESISVKGGFSGAALGQQLGYGDNVQRQTELVKQLVDGKGGLPGAIGVAVGANIGNPVIR